MSVLPLIHCGFPHCVQKAEVLVREWDALLMKEKEVKYSELLERINLQRKLIERNDVLAKELRSKEEEKQANVCALQ